MTEPTRLRKLVFSVSTFLVLILILELMSMAALYILDGKWYVPSRARSERAEARRQAQQLSNEIAKRYASRAGQVDDSENSGAGKRTGTEAPEVVHPFMGYVRDPSHENVRFEINSMGFYSSPPPDPESDRLTIGIFGGSVAAGLFTVGRSSLIKELKSAPILRNKEIWVRSFALGGYKQPQQLMALNYALAIGEQIDVVVNLDGFNDIVIAPRQLEATGLFPYYPRQWPQRMTKIPNVESLRLVGEISFLEAKRVRRGKWCSIFPLGLSPSCHLTWKVFETLSGRRLAGLRVALAKQRSEKKEYSAIGPRVEYPTEAVLLKDLSELWGRSSLQMHQVCALQGIDYLHFLQPNQYFPDSKPLSPAEKKRAIQSGHPGMRIVPVGYEYLAEVGERLEASGVAFYDLRMLFADVEETLYSDACCHFNGEGNRLMATAIARAIVEQLEMTEGSES